MSYYSKSKSRSTQLPKILAAGRGKSVSMPAIRDKIVELTEKEFPNILYLGTASHDNHDAYIDQTKGLKEVGCHIIKIDISRHEEEEDCSCSCSSSSCICSSDSDDDSCGYFSDADKEEHLSLSPSSCSDDPFDNDICTAFSKADAILASGGDTAHALKRWKETGIDELILEAAFRKRNPAVLCGGSAGGICWFSHCHIVDPLITTNSKHKQGSTTSSTSSTSRKYHRIQGMNIVPALCIPHHDITPLQAPPRSEDSDNMIMKYETLPGIGIDEAAAFVLVGNRASVVSGDGEAKCYLKYAVKNNNTSSSKRRKELKVIPLHHVDEDFDLNDILQSVTRQ